MCVCDLTHSVSVQSMLSPPTLLLTPVHSSALQRCPRRHPPGCVRPRRLPLDPTRRLHSLSQVILSQVRHTCRCASIPASRRCGCHNLPAQARGQTPHARPYFCARACSATSLSCQEFSPVLYCDCLSVVARVRRIAARPPGCSRPARRLLPAARRPLPAACRSFLHCSECTICAVSAVVY